ncbi:MULTISPECIES: DUF58 domain-containing protein [unclassified Siphonobacter]|uniref:DUF58 domain-containing protein n=1 Tax=unclassified Siphonobacter TaxID=2635712 RepID=UPI0027863ED3|nr:MULTISPECIES: DUF58 domain-containing protein [unclassified Siphonobacter]MDQ1087833.1 uncharacterized protein (DUF58 family) [Siphonobacter sp. SORGH_AS_1065]MDR6193978.1 uncharacterized protein (DUF58 family) [Siphonobacter sp. SORGH_AS_0500]
MNELLSKLRNYEIRIRKAVDSQMHGNFKSVFKGSGLEFTDLRQYQYGDDIRLIDWNASSKGHGLFLKIFKEEKEQTVFFMVDVSASQDIGREERSKLDTTKEICGVLALSAMHEASHVGLYCFSDQKEKYIRPANSMKHGYQMILELFRLKPESLKTNVSDAILFALNILHRKSVVILISDFIDTDYEQNLKALAKKHDLVVIHLYDDREVNMPRLGIIPVYDKESRRMMWVNTSSAQFRKTTRIVFEENQQRLEKLCKQYKANYLSVDTQEDYIPKLIKLFRVK